jgi:predicted transcriptional regulator
MKLRDVVNILNAEVIAGEDNLDMEIKTACAADLMSDVLAFVKAGSLLLTGLTNPQVVQTANILDIPAIVLVRNKKPSAETIALAKQLKIPLLTTKYVLFESAGRLYAKGMLSQPVVENTGKRS